MRVLAFQAIIIVLILEESLLTQLGLGIIAFGRKSNLVEDITRFRGLFDSLVDFVKRKKYMTIR